MRAFAGRQLIIDRGSQQFALTEILESSVAATAERSVAMGRQVSEQTLPVPLGLQARPDGAVLRVADVSSGSRAERAGLRGGDSIIAINGVPVAEIPMAELRAHIGASPLTLTVERDGKTLELAVPDR